MSGNELGVANPVVSREQLIDDSRFERYLEGLLRAIGPAADDGGVSRQIIRGSGRVPERPFPMDESSNRQGS